jgi:hypothetical protein
VYVRVRVSGFVCVCVCVYIYIYIYIYIYVCVCVCVLWQQRGDQVGAMVPVHQKHMSQVNCVQSCKVIRQQETA